MLILNFFDEKEPVKKKRFRKRENVSDNKRLNRYSINVNGKNVIVLDLIKRDLESESVLTLLKIYKGRVLVPEKYRDEAVLQEYLYNPKEYYQRALLSSLFNQVRAVNKDWNNLCFKIDNFTPFKEFYELVRISKTVVIVTETNLYTEKFVKDCYYRYGTVVPIKEKIPKENSDVFLNLDEIENTGILMIKVKDKAFVLYPDTRYFENCSEYQKLLPYNIEHNVICSAFSNK